MAVTKHVIAIFLLQDCNHILNYKYGHVEGDDGGGDGRGGDGE